MKKRLDKLEALAKNQENVQKQYIFADLKNYTLKIYNKAQKLIKLYTPGNAPTLKKFHESYSYHRLIMGPRGSSKSSGCCAEILFKSIQMPVCKDGIKRSKWLIGRETYGQLWETTIKTFQDWFGHAQLGWSITKKSPVNAKLRFFDGEAINHVDLLFISFDHQDDSASALSLELTGAYFNEASEIPRRALHDITGSIGRYPSQNMFSEKTAFWTGIIYDTNAFPEYHYFYEEFVKAKDTYHEFFKQPGAVLERGGDFIVNPDAENLENLPQDYYLKAIGGLPLHFVKSRFGNEFVSSEEGKPCHPEYDQRLHSLEEVKINAAYPILLGHDYGGTNATVIFQYIHKRLYAIQELIGYREGLREFHTNRVSPWLMEHCPHSVVERSIGDPADNYSHETAQNSSQIVTDCLKIRTHKALTNHIPSRLDAVDLLIHHTLVTGEKRLVVSRKGCPLLHAGLSGRYQFERIKGSEEGFIKAKPRKDQYSHVADCLQYVALYIQSLDRSEQYHSTQISPPKMVPHFENPPPLVFSPYSSSSRT